MTAVWSFWSKPLRSFTIRVGRPKGTTCLSWVLSLKTAQRHFDETVLVADSDAVAMLVDGLGLEFDVVLLALDALGDVDPTWFALGKLHAYRTLGRPFVHIDSECKYIGDRFHRPG